MASTRGNLDQRNKNRSNSDNFSDIIDIQEQTQAGIDNLRQSTIDYSLSTASARSDLTVQRAGLEYERDMHTLVGFLSVVDKLLEEIEDTKKGISKKGLSKAGKKTMDEAKTKLKQYEKQLKGKKKTLLKQQRAEIYDNDIANLRNLWEQVNRVRADIGMGQWGDFASTASYLYNSPEIAKKSNKHQTDNLKFNQNLNQIVKDGAVLTIFNRDEEAAKRYFTRIAQGNYTYSDYQIFERNSSVLTPHFQRCGIATPSDPRYYTGESRYYTGDGGYITIDGRRERVSGARRSVDYSSMDWGDTLQQGGVAGVLDKLLSNCKNMTPGQRETWKSLGVLACFAGGIYGLYKFYTNKNMGFWSKTGITAGVIFGSQALTGEGPLSLFNKLMTGGLSMDELKNKFGNVVGGLGSSGSESAETTVPAMQSMMIFGSGATAGEVHQMTKTFKADNKNRRTFYDQSCRKIKDEYGESAMENFQSTFSNDFDEEKWKNWLASFGITGETDDKETVHELANNAAMNKVAIEKFLADNKLKITNDSAKKTEFDEYVKSKNEKNDTIKTEDLKAHIKDWFIPLNQPTNPNETVTQTPQNIEIKKEKIKPAVDKGLSTIFNHFKNEYGSIVSKVGINQGSIQVYSPGITTDIISNICKTNGKTVTLDLSDSNIKQVYNNFINKFASSHSGIVKSTIKNYNWDGLKSKLNKRGLKGEMKKYNKRKNNFSVIFDSLFKEIIPVIQSQGGEIKITSNGTEFSTVKDAIASLQILNNPYK